MPTSVLFLVFAVELTLALLVSAGCLRLAALTCRVRGAAFKKALALAAGGLLVNAGAGIVILLRPDSLLLESTLVLASLLILGAGVQRLHGTRALKSAGMLLLWIGLSLVPTLGLVLAVRHALVESFHIPTAAMAPTLLGDHAELSCTACQEKEPLHWPVDDSGDLAVPSSRVDQVVGGVRCAGCGGKLALATGPSPDSGDRILVDKTTRPRRWEVACFVPPRKPSVLYAKRLVGLPGETLEIACGEVFVGGRILRKPAEAAGDLWLPVRGKPAIAGARSPWREDGGGAWSFDGLEAARAALEYSGDVNDTLMYNALFLSQPSRPEPVTDVRLTCEAASFEGAGELSFEWERGDLKVRAAATREGGIALECAGRRARAALPEPVDGGMRIAFAVRDGLAAVMVRGRAVLSLEVEPQDMEGLRSARAGGQALTRLALAAERCRLKLSSVALERDVHYRVQSLGSGAQRFHLILGPGEHAFLGDNSAVSADSRYYGPVPEENIVGVVRWIFWPPARMRTLEQE